jgi:DMSO/TMAO reductase YedYZ molybdopterin-dependent catalytic subunit
MPMKKSRTSNDEAYVAKHVMPLLATPSRRLFLKGGFSLGALSLLSGCSLTDHQDVERALQRISQWNDQAQAWLFNPERLAKTYQPSAIERPFRFNAYYDKADAPVVDLATYQLDVAGLVANKAPWTIDALRALPQETQITRLICIEGWSMVGRWRGVRFSTFLERIGADLSARYVGFRCADTYTTSIDMATALHPQTQLTLAFDDHAAIKPYYLGAPVRLRVPTKLGFKNAKHIIVIEVTNTNPGGYWERYGYNWFSGL